MDHPPYRIVPCLDGSFTIQGDGMPESMHSRIGPWAEATTIYAAQSPFSSLIQQADSSPVVLLDIGMGIAANAIAAIETFRKLERPQRGLEIHSFENDLRGLELALSGRTTLEKFPFLERHASALKTLTEKGRFTEGAIQWVLHRGDFRQKLSDAPRADLIYFDFYSSRANPELWEVSTFRQIREHQISADAVKPSLLMTYSSATHVRVAMLLAGLFVGHGARTEVKRETTLAATHLELLEDPLGEMWLEKLNRSRRLHPADLDERNVPRDELVERIRSHLQFCQLSSGSRDGERLPRS